jgi:hypothetical protein
VARPERLEHEGFANASRARCRLYALSLGLACAISVVCRGAAAQSGTPLRVLVAEGACADANHIQGRMRAHNPEQTFTSAEQPAALTLRFSFTPQHNAITGRLSLGTSEGPTEQAREIVGSSCAEVVEALVLVALVLVESVASNDQGAALVVTTPPVETQPVVEPGPIVRAVEEPEVDGLHVRILMAAGAGFVAGQLPRAAGRVQLGAGLELMRRADAVLASARLVGAFSDAGRVTTAMQQSTFWSLTGRLELAGPRLAFRWLGADACALLELGRVQAVVQRAGPDQTAHAQWLAAGGLARVFASLPRHLRLEFEFGVFARLRPAEFRFERVDGSLAGVWRFPAWGLQTAIGVALPFS